jgi:quinol monooxygenase YgiN
VKRHIRSFYGAPALALIILAAAPSGARTEDGPGRGYSAVSTGAYSVVAEIRAKPGQADALRAATLPLVPLVRSDPKNLVYFLQEDRDEPGHFFFYEIFASEADFEAHNAQPYVKAWFAKLPALADGHVQTIKMAILNGPSR